MNQRFLLGATLCLGLSANAQVDTTAKPAPAAAPAPDTLHVGSLIIVKEGKGTSDYSDEHHYYWYHHHYHTPANLTTQWVVFDIGFANYNDKTDYSSPGAQSFAPGSTQDWFALRTGKSVDVNIWLFMQRLNLIKHVVNLKYGFGIELNNYRYDENIRYLTGPTKVIMDTVPHFKNKLAVDYVTIPLYLNFNFTPHRHKNDFGLSLGASVGYRYSSRQKFKSDAEGVEKTHHNFDLEAWKISWIGELQLGWLSLYGSYATKSMFQQGLNQIPYTVGLRFAFGED
jgi:hypothetical protein